jgi:hypothetical protein
MAQSSVILTTSILAFIDWNFGSLFVFCARRKTFVTTSQRHYKTYATYTRSWAVTISPSLILHGRTEIKARALVLGEVSALSFCLPAILPTFNRKGTKTLSF